MIATAANLLWLASRQAAARRFRRQLHNPAETQRAVLLDLLQRNASSAFGRQHDFEDLRTPDDFAARVPLAKPDDLEPWVQRIRQGERAVLTTEAVTHLVPTSGSSGARKLIPFTAQLQREFDRAIGPWVDGLYRDHPSALFGPSYWSVSPALPPAAGEDSLVPVGFDDDTAYLGGTVRRLVGATLAAPTVLREVREIEPFFLLTLVCLLRRRDLRLVSVWHPSFLLLLLEALPRHWAAVVATIATGRLPPGVAISARVESALGLKPQPARARDLERLGPNAPHRFWPALAVISCWTDAHAANAAKEVARRFPNVSLQPKGLLATEAFVTVPYAGRHPVALGSHYFEFIDDHGAIHPVESLRADEIYEVVVTTGGGLWRYRLGDRVRVDGFVGRTPSLRFIGRTGNVSDLRGEKITGEFAATVLRGLSSRPPVFAMLAAEADGAAGVYILFWEGEAAPTATDLDRRLSLNPHYAWCRRLGQLRTPRVFLIESGGTAAYYRRSAARQKLGDIKPPALAPGSGWADCFTGRFAM